MSRPIIVIPCCTKEIDGYVYDTVRRGYAAPVAEVAACQPLLIPLDTALTDLGAVLDVADGILLSGSPSNLAPAHYGNEKPAEADKLDTARDALTLPLAREAVANNIPLFAICRGFQELNVALGGSLHQEVHKEDGRNDHRANDDLPLPEQWQDVHSVRLEEELRDWLGCEVIQVNSLHGQGIRKLSDQLRPQAYAEDGLIEAAMGPRELTFCLGVQWHPEWETHKNEASIELFRRFGAAARSNQA